MMQEPIRITIIEDDATIREGYQYLLNTAEDCTVVSTYPSVEGALRKIEHDAPNVVLLDVELPGTNGTDALRKIKKLLPDAYVIILTVYEQDTLIFRALGN